ncbi:MAG: formylglycine-generating enzyme family protein [bacterium]|nr:formylglycine-generating enzyme family protein [bacterium]
MPPSLSMWRIPLLLSLALVGCARKRSAPEWAEVVAWDADPAVVTDAGLRARIAELALPWHVRHAASGIELLLVPAGTYERGAAEGDTEAASDEQPRHRVSVAQPFYIGRFEVTQGEWQHVLGTEPSHFDGEPRRPVENVTYFEVQEFLERAALVLPTEGEWEYACRAGEEAARHGALDDVAWYRSNAESMTHPVGGKATNALGLHDMLGNVWEWTSTWYESDTYAACVDGVDAKHGPPGGLQMVLRGGSWYDAAVRARASARYSAPWPFEAGHVGLRVVRTP